MCHFQQCWTLETHFAMGRQCSPPSCCQLPAKVLPGRNDTPSYWTYAAARTHCCLADLVGTSPGVPPFAVHGGYEGNGSPLFVARGSHGGGLHPGKSDGTQCWIGYAGQEVVLQVGPPFPLTVECESFMTSIALVVFEHTSPSCMFGPHPPYVHALSPSS